MLFTYCRIATQSQLLQYIALSFLCHLCSANWCHETPVNRITPHKQISASPSQRRSIQTNFWHHVNTSSCHTFCFVHVHDISPPKSSQLYATLTLRGYAVHKITREYKGSPQSLTLCFTNRKLIDFICQPSWFHWNKILKKRTTFLSFPILQWIHE